MLGRLIGIIIVILISVSLVPEISNQINIYKQTNNPDQIMNFMLDIIPLMFGVCIAFTCIVMAYSTLREIGYFGGDYDNTDEEEPTKKPTKHKQTYKEYVKERLEIERMMKKGVVNNV